MRVDCSQHSLEQIEKQMHKLVNVLRVSELEPGQAVERELALITVAAPPATRPELLSLAEVFGVRVADVGPDAIVFEVVGAPEHLEAFEELAASARHQGARPHGPDRPRPRVRRARRQQATRQQLTKGTSIVATIYNDGNVELLSGKVAVLGYGSQGHAHALNLHESGVDVVVGLRAGSASREAAEEAGLAVATVAEAVAGAQLVVFLLPDQVQPSVYEEDVAPNLAEGAALVFAHGFNVHYGRIPAPPGHDVLMVAPKGPGHVVRRLFTEGLGVPAVVAVAQDASGQALELALAYGTALGAGRAGHDRDDLRGGDRDRPLRRAGGALRRHDRADPRRLRDARRGGLPARGRLLRVPARAEADRRPDLGGRPLAHALVDLGHRRVRRPDARGRA